MYLKGTENERREKLQGRLTKGIIERNIIKWKEAVWEFKMAGRKI